MFILFTGMQYHPSGGALDTTTAFPTLLDAVVSRPNCDWAHVAEVTADGLKIAAIWGPDTPPTHVAGSLNMAGYNLEAPGLDVETTDPWHRELCASATR